MDKKNNIHIKVFFCILLIFPKLVFSQGNVKAMFVVEKGKFIFDKESYKLLQNQLKEISAQQKEKDSILKNNPNIFFSEIDDRITTFPRLNSKNLNTRDKITSNLNLKNIKFGKNLMSININKNGEATNFKCIEASDKQICKQIKKLFKKDEFKKWHNAQFSSIDVNYEFKFSIIVDSNFSNYDLKNKWSLEDHNLHIFNK